MGEIATSTMQLPDTIEDLSKFVLVNEERITALKAQIRAIKKVNLAKEVYEQKLAEAQEIGEITVAAAQKMGELLLQIQKQSGARTDLTSADSTDKVKTKSEVISEIGLERHTANEYQQMAQNPEAVQAAIQKAIDNGDVVSRAQVMKEIRAIKDQLAEKDRKITELESREPEIREVTKEVVPADYDNLKRKADRIDSYKKDFEDMRSRYEEAARKWQDSETKLQSMIDESNRPEKQHEERIKADVLALCAGISNFLEKYGGYVYLSHEFDGMTKTEREGLNRGITALYQWADEMLNTNTERVIK